MKKLLLLTLLSTALLFAKDSFKNHEQKMRIQKERGTKEISREKNSYTQEQSNRYRYKNSYKSSIEQSSSSMQSTQRGAMETDNSSDLIIP
ncbi:MAG: hypothetical protein WCY51_04215 [Sulfurimonas sp.]|uniref:hypothetical protein n=1 Tax=Sulfurimonas sp. TaxID=2022749 RepID=UPI0025DA65D5|nr:hypothetical protein [Sulfurimonas sp.]MCK9454793.1 hypothetical protein [Sulfurimonas sp.]